MQQHIRLLYLLVLYTVATCVGHSLNDQYYYDKPPAKCVACPPGTFSNASSDMCADCSSGECNATEFCTPCSPGYHNPNFNESQCLPCDIGTYANAHELENCLKCNVGTFSNETGLVQCYLCEPGTFTNQNGSKECELCPLGSNQTQRGMSKCEECPIGTYCNSTGCAECNLCDKGQYQNEMGSTDCKLCPSTTHSNKTGQRECVKCNGGTICNTTGCVNCQPCEPGSASQNGANCTLCQIGKYSLRGWSSCQSCQDDKYCDIIGCSECKWCGPGRQSENHWSCSVCSKGTHSNRTSKCIPCDKGWYQLKLGQEICNKCKEGYYCQNPAAEPIKCTGNEICPAGSYKADTCIIGLEPNGSNTNCQVSYWLWIVICATIAILIGILAILATVLYRNVWKPRRKLAAEKIPLMTTPRNKSDSVVSNKSSDTTPIVYGGY